MIKAALLKLIQGNEGPVQKAPRASQIFLDAQGRELVDGRPMAPPIGYRPEPSLMETIHAMVKRVSDEMGENGDETLEDSEDFYIEDDMDPETSYELDGLTNEELFEEAHRRGLFTQKAPSPEPLPEKAKPLSKKPPAAASEPAATAANEADEQSA